MKHETTHTINFPADRENDSQIEYVFHPPQKGDRETPPVEPWLEILKVDGRSPKEIELPPNIGFWEYWDIIAEGILTIHMEKYDC